MGAVPCVFGFLAALAFRERLAGTGSDAIFSFQSSPKSIGVDGSFLAFFAMTQFPAFAAFAFGG